MTVINDRTIYYAVREHQSNNIYGFSRDAMVVQLVTTMSGESPSFARRHAVTRTEYGLYSAETGPLVPAAETRRETLRRCAAVRSCVATA